MSWGAPLPVEDLSNQYECVRQWLLNLSVGTHRNYKYYLRKFMEFSGWNPDQILELAKSNSKSVHTKLKEFWYTMKDQERLASTLANCFLKPLGTAGCTHWQQGIGAPNGLGTIGLSQISGVSRFYLLNWTSPYTWTGLSGIATGSANSFDGLPAPQLQEYDPSLPNSMFLNPASIGGCNTATPYPQTGSGYDC